MTINEVYQRNLLGRFVSSVEEYYKVSDKVAPDMFTGVYFEIFSVFQAKLIQEKHPSLQLLISCLPQHREVLYYIIRELDYTIPVEDLLEELEEGRRQAILRDLQMVLSTEQDSEAHVANITRAVELISVTRGSGYETIGGIVDDVLSSVSVVQSGVVPGVPTGFAGFDSITGGLQKTDLVVIAAEPSQGKTSLALNIAEYSKRKCAIISLEMGKQQLVERLIFSLAETPKHLVKTPNPCPISFQKFLAASEQMRKSGIIIADIKNNDVINVCGLIRAAVMRFNAEFVVIDYLQLIHSRKATNREQEVGAIARALKNLAKELNIPIVVLSQLNRSQTDNFPTMRRLRDSGQIEEAADVIWFVYRPEEYRIQEFDGEPTSGLAINIIAKGRNYGTGIFKTTFNKSITKFVARDNSDDRLHHGDRHDAVGLSQESIRPLDF